MAQVLWRKGGTCPPPTWPRGAGSRLGVPGCQQGVGGFPESCSPTFPGQCFVPIGLSHPVPRASACRELPPLTICSFLEPPGLAGGEAGPGLWPMGHGDEC